MQLLNVVCEALLNTGNVDDAKVLEMDSGDGWQRCDST